MTIDAKDIVPSLWDVQAKPSPTNTWPLGSPSLAWSNLYLGPNGAPVFDPATGNVGFWKQTTAENAISVTPTNFFYPPLNVKRYGAKGDGVTDDRAAIKTAWLVAVQMGGGWIVFPDGATYFVSTLDPLSPLIFPNQNANGTIGTQSYQCVFVFRGGSNIDFDFQGSNITTNITGGGNFFVFDNCNNIRLIAPHINGAQVMSTGVVAGTITNGGNYTTNGTYRKVPLTGGSGSGAYVDTVVVSGNTVTSITVSSSDPTQNYPGGNYAVPDVLGATVASLGGTGTGGLQFTLTSVTGAGPTVATAAQNAIVCCALTGSTSEIDVINPVIKKMYAGFWCIADPTNSPQNTVTHTHVRGTFRFENGFYAYALHNAGDNSTLDNLYAYRDDRGVFLYGVQNVTVGTVTVDQLNFGFQSLIKAYSRNTSGIRIGNYWAINQPGQSASVGRIAIQVQSDPANTNPTVKDLFITYNERNITAGQAIEWDYYSGVGGTTLTTSTSNVLFNNHVLEGNTAGNLFTNVALQGASAACKVDFSRMKYFQPVAANSPDAGNGFVKTYKFGFTPALTFSGGAGTSTLAATMEYYFVSGLLKCYMKITGSVGTANGNLSWTMPFVPRQDESQNALGYGIGTGLAGLTGPVSGFMASSGATTFTPVIQGAAAYAQMTAANFGAGPSTLLMNIDYPV